MTAQDSCKLLNGSLASIHSEEEHNFILNIIPPNTNISLPVYAFWIGLVDHDMSGNWSWLDGSQSNYFNWGSLEPNYEYMPMNDTCTVLVVSGKEYLWQYAGGKWADDYCGHKNEPASPDTIKEQWRPLFGGWHQGAICQQEPKATLTTVTPSTPTSTSMISTSQANANETSNPCVNGWHYYKSKNKCFQTVIKALSHSQAIKTCEELNSTLASIHSVEENDFIVDIIPLTPGLHNYGFWIGLVDYNRSGNWTWLDGSPTDYLNWGKRDPNYSVWPWFGSYEKKIPYNIACTVIYIDGTDPWIIQSVSQQWTDEICEIDLATENGILFQGAICQKQVDTSEVNHTGEYVHEYEFSCDSDWALFNQTQMCYRVFYAELNAEGMDFFTANNTCYNNNSTLTSIHIIEENEFIANLTKPYNDQAIYAFWIGYVDQYMHGIFYWLDGSRTNFRHWGLGEPQLWNKLNMSLTCTIYVINGTEWWTQNALHEWVDYYCDNQMSGAICKKDPIVHIKQATTQTTTPTNQQGTVTTIHNGSNG
uniref:C-type lectin domain-containing protein n=1 Tax=Acrobeloides nanus TaxID=290746 RepID=A0A914E4A7_9BILA